MASISKERLREMEEEMDRFEAEIQTPGQPQGSGFILGANTFNQVQAALTTLRRQADDVGLSRPRDEQAGERQQHSQPTQHSNRQQQEEDIDGDNLYGDEDLRFNNWNGRKPTENKEESRRPPQHDSDDNINEFFDVDERPGRAHGPRVAPPPPPPPPPPPGVQPSHTSNGSARPSNVLAPPPPPPPPDTMNAAAHPPPAFMPPQLRHRMPLRPPPGHRPPFLRPPGMRPPPPPPQQGPYGRPPAPGGPHFMGGPGPGMGGPPGHNMGHPGMNPAMHHPPMGPPMGMGHGVGMPIGPQGVPQDMGGGVMPGMTGEGPKPAEGESNPKVYSAAPVINLELKKDETKKKKKKKKVKEGDAVPSIGPTPPSSTPTSSASSMATDNNTPASNMEMAPGGGSAYGNFMAVNAAHHGAGGMMSGQHQQHMAQMGGGMSQGMMSQSQMQQGMMSSQPMMHGMNNMAGGGGMDGSGHGSMPGVAGGGVGKKDKKKKEKKFIRLAANTTWEDPTLSEWANDDYRMFAGDLGNEVTDDTLVRAFSKYPGFLKAKVIRDRRSDKTKGYGFISFKDPVDFARAMREMNGKYVGNRPIKLRKSNWKDRNIEVVRKKDKEKKRLGLK